MNDMAAIICPKYCRNGVKHYIVNQSTFLDKLTGMEMLFTMFTFFDTLTGPTVMFSMFTFIDTL